MSINSYLEKAEDIYEKFKVNARKFFYVLKSPIKIYDELEYLKRYKLSLEDLNSINESLRADKKNLFSSINCLRNDYSILKVELNEAKSLSEIVQRELNAKKIELETTKSLLDISEADLKNRASELEKVLDLNDNYEKELVSLRSKFQDLNQDYEKLQGMYSNSRHVMHRIQIDLRKKHRDCIDLFKNFVKEVAEKDDFELSYVIIGGSSKVIAATPAFLERFGFEKEDVIGKPYFDLLKRPSGEEEGYVQRVKEYFRDSKNKEEYTYIFDGKGKSRYVRLIRHEPHKIVYDAIDGEGHLNEKKDVADYFFTRVDFISLGILEKGKKLFFHNEEPKTLEQAVSKREIEKLKEKRAMEELDEPVKDIVGMVLKGLTIKEIDSFWKESKTYVEYHDKCWGAIYESEKVFFLKRGLNEAIINDLWEKSLSYKEFQENAKQEAANLKLKK
ncbi:MAG: hypothetical protein ACP5OG_02805 [Candidatus Nanoarchaeia archaeon]